MSDEVEEESTAMSGEVEEEVKAKRIAVLFNVADMAAITKEVSLRSEALGYPVSVSDALRDLVRTQWGSRWGR